MTTLTKESHDWIEAVCTRFSAATGWPMVFRPVEAANSLVLEEALERDEKCPWFTEVRDETQRAGFLHLGLPDDPQADRAFQGVSELAQIVADLIGQLVTAGSSLQSRTQDVSTLVDIGLSIPKEDDLLGALYQLLRASVQLTGFRSAGFFLLNPSRNQLNLRVLYHLDSEDIPFSTRDLSDNPPDLEALSQGALVLRRLQPSDRLRWLPNDASTGICLAVQSSAGPIGTLWIFDRRDREPTSRETHVLQSIAAQMAVVLERVVLLKESETQHRLQQELLVAKESQTNDVLSKLPPDAGFEAAAVCTSHYEVGGDLCELIPIDEHRTIVAVGDASGDSIPAALIMSAVRGSLRTLSLDEPDVVVQTERAMQRINESLHAITPAHQFMSMLYGILDTKARTFAYTNAGHPSPIFVQDGMTSDLESHGMLLGVLKESTYGSTTIELNAGDMLVLFSDGISEAMSRRHQMFRCDGILEAVENRTTSSAKGVLDAILTRLESHIAGGGDADDRTLLVIKIQ